MRAKRQMSAHLFHRFRCYLMPHQAHVTCGNARSSTTPPTHECPAPGHPRGTRTGMSACRSRSADGLDDRVVESCERGEVLRALLLDPRDHGVVFIQAALPLVELAWLQDLGVVDARQGFGDFVAEVLVGLPFDAVLDDGLDHR